MSSGKWRTSCLGLNVLRGIDVPMILASFVLGYDSTLIFGTKSLPYMKINCYKTYPEIRFMKQVSRSTYFIQGASLQLILFVQITIGKRGITVPYCLIVIILVTWVPSKKTEI